MSGTGTEHSQKPPGTHATLKGGRYIVARKLAEGGTAFVHLGWDNDLKQHRAIKTLLPEYAKRPALRHRFENEARTMQALVHPNIVTVFDAGQEGETAYLVMELCPGGSVIDWVERNGKMPPRMACRVVLDVAAGMAFAHERGIIHRDIKPQNVLVDGDGTCKVTDFGIAQIVEETRMTMTGTVMGTLGYMAPEQHESAKHADARADIYSLAATLYTLLAGEAPTHLFMADDRDFEGIPAPVVEVIRKGSQYRRELRYETMEAFGAALQAAYDTLPADPEVPPLVRPGGPKLTDLEPPTGGSVEPPTPAPVVLPSAPPPPTALVSASPAAPLQIKSKSEEPATPSLARITLNEEGPRIRGSGSLELRAREDRRRKVIAVVVAVFAVAAFVFALVVVVGGTRVTGFETLRDHADEQLYAQVHEERVILDALEPLGLPQQQTIRSLFDECETGDREDREAATNRLLATLDQVRRDLEVGQASQQQHIVKQLRETVRRIQGRLAEVRERDARLEEVRSSPTGRVATLIGL
jgi:serine/threonine protein kinase